MPLNPESHKDIKITKDQEILTPSVCEFDLINFFD